MRLHEIVKALDINRVHCRKSLKNLIGLGIIEQIIEFDNYFYCLQQQSARERRGLHEDAPRTPRGSTGDSMRVRPRLHEDAPRTPHGSAGNSMRVRRGLHEDAPGTPHGSEEDSPVLPLPNVHKHGRQNRSRPLRIGNKSNRRSKSRQARTGFDHRITYGFQSERREVGNRHICVQLKKRSTHIDEMLIGAGDSAVLDVESMQARFRSFLWWIRGISPGFVRCRTVFFFVMAILNCLALMPQGH